MTATIQTLARLAILAVLARSISADTNPNNITNTTGSDTVKSALANSSSLGTDTALASAAITSAATWSGGILPAPFTSWYNVTYATSCAYNDKTCLGICESYWTSCSSEWENYVDGELGIFTSSTYSTWYFVETTVEPNQVLSTTTWTYTSAGDGEDYTGTTTLGIASREGSTVTKTHTGTYASWIHSYTNSILPPSCSSNPDGYNHIPDCTSGCNPNYCTIQGGTVQLLYWPVATTSLVSIANGSISTMIIPITPNPNKTTTMSYQNTTLTAPTVYISFETAFALNDCSSAVGKNHTGDILPLPPNQLSSIHGSLGPRFIYTGCVNFCASWVPASFDYTNLALTPVPLSVYLDQPSCYDSFCSTIYPDYAPVLSVPQQIRSLDPAWATCDLYWKGVNDPPKALQPANSVAGVTTEVGGVTSPSMSAAPYSTVPPPTVTATTIPDSISTTSAGLVDAPSGYQPSSSTFQTPVSYSSVSSASAGETSPTSDPSSFTSSVSVDTGSNFDATHSGATSIPPQPGSSVRTPASVSLVSSSSQTNNAGSTSDALMASQASSGATSPTNALEVLTQSQSHNSGLVSVVSTDGSQRTVVAPTTVLVIFQSVTYTVVQAAAPAVDTDIESDTLSGSTQTVAVTPQATFTVDSDTYTAYQVQGATRAVVVGSGTTLTLAAGAGTQLAGADLSVDSFGNAIIGGTLLEYNSAGLSSATSSRATSTSNSGGRVLTILLPGSGYAVESVVTTISIGGPAATISGQLVSLASQGLVTLSDSTTSLKPPAKTFSGTQLVAVLTLESKTVTAFQMAGSQGVIEIDGSTFSTGGPGQSVAGAVVSAVSNGVVADGTTIPYSIATAANPSQETAPPTTVYGRSSQTTPSESLGDIPSQQPSATATNSSPTLSRLGVFAVLIISMALLAMV